MIMGSMGFGGNHNLGQARLSALGRTDGQDKSYDHGLDGFWENHNLGQPRLSALGRTDGQTDRQTDGQTDRQTDKVKHTGL
jgi:hypothetical protein